jgi:hypothetical protein
MEAFIYSCVTGLICTAMGFFMGLRAAKAAPKKYQRYYNLKTGEVRDATEKLIGQ